MSRYVTPQAARQALGVSDQSGGGSEEAAFDETRPVSGGFASAVADSPGGEEGCDSDDRGEIVSVLHHLRRVGRLLPRDAAPASAASPKNGRGLGAAI